MPKSLNEQNNARTWATIVANVVVFYGVCTIGNGFIYEFQRIYIQVEAFLPVVLTGVISTVLNSIFSPTMKARIVYLRWNDALPGHRAFSIYAKEDPRVDVAKLESNIGKPFPLDGKEQNSLWFGLYKTVKDEVSVYEAHRDTLFLRNYSALCLEFLLILPAFVFYYIGQNFISASYAFCMLVQFFLVRHSAAVSGVRMVKNVLALKSL